MTRTVFDNDMVAHIWAQQEQSEAKSHNGNFWFRDDTIYSYSTPIARIVQDLAGRRVALGTSEKYSQTTEGKHKNAIWRATRHMTCFHVPVLGVSGGRYNGGNLTATEGHAANLKYLIEQYATLKATLLRARDPYQPATQLERASHTARDYAAAFGLANPDLPHMVDASEIAVAHYKRNEKYNTPEAMAKREKDKERRAIAKERKEAAEAQARFEKQAEDRAKWLAGEWVYTYRLDDGNGGALLRVKQNDDGGILQTSQGAEVPLDHAIKAFRAIKRMKTAGTAWQRNGHTIRVGHFQIDSIDIAGNIRAGCHLINWSEIERIAKLLGIFDDDTGPDGMVPQMPDTAQEVTAHHFA